MGFFSKMKKKLKKLKLKNIGKDLAKGLDSVANIAKNLPAPVGTIAKGVTKGFDLAEKVKAKADKLKQKYGDSGLEQSLKMVGGSRKSSITRATSSKPSYQDRQSLREERKALRLKARIAKKKARRDGYRAYN